MWVNAELFPALALWQVFFVVGCCFWLLALVCSDYEDKRRHLWLHAGFAVYTVCITAGSIYFFYLWT